jgi:predicted O-methyltransferase YrrM
MWYHHSYPEHPWLTKTANLILSLYLQDTDVGLEFGSGRSTIWFARKTKSLTSVEHDISWYNKISTQLRHENLSNVRYYFKEQETIESFTLPSYVRVIEEFEPESLNFVLVDGVYRNMCAYMAVAKVTPGGLIVVDNANWFIPSNSFSPNSRTARMGYMEDWEQFASAVSNWRCIWTTNGVTDTALYLKPCI